MKNKQKVGLTPAAVHIGLLVGVPIAVVLGIKAIASAAVSKTWNSGEVLKAADLNATLAALDQRITTLESGVGSNVMVITATVPPGIAGGTASAMCPDGYKLAMVSLVDVQVTDGGINGWPMGTWGCANNTGKLVAGLTNYATGSTQSTITCQGLCIK